jgi:methanogenic corrinoid protein MtbC1
MPGEQHDLGLIAFGLALRARGWRIAYLGGDMPLESVLSAARAVDPAAVVLSSVDPEGFRRFGSELETVAREHRTYFGGAGASEVHAKAAGATFLSGGPVEEAERLTELVDR